MTSPTTGAVTPAEPDPRVTAVSLAVSFDEKAHLRFLARCRNVTVSSLFLPAAEQLVKEARELAAELGVTIQPEDPRG